MPIGGKRLDHWKQQLLDLGKRNRLISFKETKRSNVQITIPSLNQLFDTLVRKESPMTFPSSRKVEFSDEGEETLSELVEGDIKTNKTTPELIKTLKVLRSKAKESLEEQGINTLFLAFGIVRWNENEPISKQIVSSPLILVPVNLNIESLTSPFILTLSEDEIVVNPSLKFKFSNDFGIELPDFDYENDSIQDFFSLVKQKISDQNWIIVDEVHLTLLSFLKINMYRDLDRNADRILGNRIISAISGQESSIPLETQYNNYDHDKLVKPIDTYQVLEADSSQLDAILLSKKGASFVLQGPPGTGKSQTITNILAEALADGKKVLFVAEKMAALHVVHKRLSKVGLDDFCLTLHNHKANRKEILNQLNRTLNLDKIRIKEEALYELEKLQNLRERLNKYNVELHTPCQPLNRTLFQINGEIARLKDIPEEIFEIEAIKETTGAVLNETKYLLEQLSITMGRLSEFPSDNPWNGSTIKMLTHEFRHDLEANLKKLVIQIREANKVFSDIKREFHFTQESTISGVETVLNILDLSKQSPGILLDWLSCENFDNLINEASSLGEMCKEYSSKKAQLRNRHKCENFSFPGVYFNNTIISSIGNIESLVNRNIYTTKEQIFTSIDKLNSISNECLSKLRTGINESEYLSSVMGVTKPNSLSSMQMLGELSNLVTKNIRPAEEWFEKESKNSIDNYFEKVKSTYEVQSRLKLKISEIYDSEIFDVDITDILGRFRSEYTSVLKYLNSNYSKDKKLLRRYIKKINASYSDSDITMSLNYINDWKKGNKWIQENKCYFKQKLGGVFDEEDTEWFLLAENIANFYKIYSLLNGDFNSNNVKSLLLSKSDSFRDFSQRVQLITQVDYQFITDVYEALDKDAVDPEDIRRILTNLSSFQDSINSLAECRSALPGFLSKISSYNDLIDDVNLLMRIESIEAYFNDESSSLCEKFGTRYKGLETDWASVCNALHFSRQFQEIQLKYDLSSEFVKLICCNLSDNSSIKQAQIRLLESFLKKSDQFLWFCKLFNKKTFDSILFDDLEIFVSKCYTNIFLLEEWIDFRINREKCQAAGLDNYLKVIDEKKISKELIVPVFLKRFYRVWMDLFITGFPIVLSFRGRDHEEKISEFRKLDASQLVIARTRIRQRLIESLPDLNLATSSLDEVGILKRELKKQRKLLPIRKLFSLMPNLVTTLKPCLMMSPLSVSVFLEAESYDFDLVIFDEASQIRTEDAIGAIMRGKQLIIVGDSNQLPPSNFFSASNHDSDYDSEGKEDDDVGAYESILDEAIVAIPEKSLRWHYRSKHESLISFSNSEIYNNGLITFPSSVDKLKDNGVEYVYVKDGIFDSGGKATNILEGKRVVQLVGEHILTYPSRSLGVVTFSLSQKLAIEGLIAKFRNENPAYEEFFSSEKEEAFFIKNLENVQGDERDTIIFSIGYAKNHTGKMYQNFGPLSKQGGDRRLNVAVTRAKHNVKLVGSIKPPDIEINDESTPRGTRLLRAYVDFAINGDSVLLNKINSTENIVLESPFEESVYNFLVSKGFRVATQVGCSGYRIDMAIRHPNLNGIFVIGIECDGATYHSSRTARDRDRLRQIVLEDIGWKIYRIWSTDWIKDPITEGERLCNAIKAAIENYEESFDKPLNGELSIINFASEDFIDDEPECFNDLQRESDFGFVEYKCANVMALKFNLNFNTYLSDAIMHVVEEEYPIHFDNLCKRLLPLYKGQKVTLKISQEIRLSLDWLRKDKLQLIDHFISPVGDLPIPVRFVSENGLNRTITQISKFELAEALLLVAKKSIGIRSEELITSTGRELGFRRLTDGIKFSLSVALEHLLVTNKLLKDRDDKLIIPKI